MKEIQKHRKTMIMATTGLCAISVLFFLMSIVFWLRRYPVLRYNEMDSGHVIFEPADFHDFVQVLRGTFFLLIPLVGIILLIAAHAIWKISQYVSAEFEKTA